MEAYEVKMRSVEKHFEGEREKASREARAEEAQWSEELAAEKRRHVAAAERAAALGAQVQAEVSPLPYCIFKHPD